MPSPTQPFLMVLGIAQDAGYPQAACQKDCCRLIWAKPEQHQLVACLALIDPAQGKGWLIDATPDFKTQLFLLEQSVKGAKIDLAGIFLTHAHIGHYTGLMHLGREVMGAKQMPVYAMPRMAEFLKAHGPWSQLVDLGNIDIQPLATDSIIQLSGGLRLEPFLVPHRDEFSETVGFRISGPRKSALYIPDIDKWEKWERDIKTVLQSVDIAFVDGTFYQNGEIPGRNMAEIPHPFIEESVSLLKSLSPAEKQKIHFIHFNHTNPVLDAQSQACKDLKSAGFQRAKALQIVEL